MRVVISVPGPDEDGTLLEAAARMWTDFTQVVRNPLGTAHVSYDTDAPEPDAVAWCHPVYGPSSGIGLGDCALITPSTRLLTTASDTERRLTLLHECIHMDFAFGEHRDRWQRIDQRGMLWSKNTKAVSWTDVDLTDYMERRVSVAIMFLRLPDEIVAEQRLKRGYPEWFDARAAYYVHLQQGHAAEVAAPRSDVPLRPFHVFCELLRASLFIPLVAGMAQFEDELRRLEKNADDHLREYAQPGLPEFLLGLKPRLLDVTLDRPLAAAEAAYDELFERVITTDPDARKASAN